MAYFLLHSGQPSAKRLAKRVARLGTYKSSNTVADADVVIRWGAGEESDPPAGQVLNSREAVLRTVSRLNMGRLLRRVGVRFADRAQAVGTAAGDVRFQRHYRVPVFDMRALACFRSDASPVWLNQRVQRVPESFREISLTEEPVTMRVVYLAMRTLHALGLDFGLVSIGMAPKGILYVYDVVPTPVLAGRMLELFSAAVNEFIEQEEQTSDNPGLVTLGTDVEIMLRNANGKMVLASNYFPRKGRIGCDDRSVRFDGRRLPLMELRPDPDTSPIGLLSNLREVMEEAACTIDRTRVEWRAGSMPFRPFCTGGHIHFSGIRLTRRLVRALDNYVGLPLMLVEDRRTAQLRRPRYGFLGDVRPKDHGGFEYRTPASFVVDRDVTAAAFCLAYLVALYHRELPLADLYEPNLQSAFYRGDVDALRPIAERNADAIRQLPLYERFRDYIEPLFQMIAERRTWDEDADVRRAWGVPLSRREGERPDDGVDSVRRRSVARLSG
ncbi:MAG: hypothetical protein IRZ33_10155 [Alicyclobacillaceae bacterium]|nr:hypothetical protein [Alicyclobacillaceae bacterium]